MSFISVPSLRLRMCRWHWSGGFAMAAKEAYFGLRVRNDRSPDVAVNIPVNSTVGPSGTFYLLPSILSNPPNIGCWASTSCTNVWRYCDHSGCLVCFVTISHGRCSAQGAMLLDSVSVA